MEKDIGLVVAERADWVLSVVGVGESANYEVWQSVEIQNFFEVADTVGRNVQFSQIDKTVQADSDRFNIVLGDVKFC